MNEWMNEWELTLKVISKTYHKALFGPVLLTFFFIDLVNEFELTQIDLDQWPQSMNEIIQGIHVKEIRETKVGQTLDGRAQIKKNHVKLTKETYQIK